MLSNYCENEKKEKVLQLFVLLYFLYLYLKSSFSLTCPLLFFHRNLSTIFHWKRSNGRILDFAEAHFAWVGSSFLGVRRPTFLRIFQLLLNVPLLLFLLTFIPCKFVGYGLKDWVILYMSVSSRQYSCHISCPASIMHNHC